MRFFLAVAALVAIAVPARAEQIRCTAPGESPVAISLKSQRYAGRDLNCISGAFVAGLTPCAPTRAFSLSAPTEPAAIVGVVDCWQDYARHEGGVVGYFESHTTIAFTGGFDRPGSDYRDDWSLRRPSHPARDADPEGQAQGRVFVRRRALRAIGRREQHPRSIARRGGAG